MFTKLKNEIEFADIEAFCHEWPEGVRVEYKREITNSLPKIISSFANTLGGIIIIGVATDDNNRVKFPIEGIVNERGIEERIVQSALDNIYPAVMPDIVICNVKIDEAETDKVVVVIRVDESQQAPHAIQNRTRVYIRLESITPPYELAEIDRIEYLLKRRDEPREICQNILNRIDRRQVAQRSSPEHPNLALYSHPIFPYRPVISTAEIHEHMYRAVGIPHRLGDPEFGTRKVSGGVCYMGIEVHNEFWELNEYGIIYNRKWVTPQTPNNNSIEDEGKRYLAGRDIIAQIHRFIYEARGFYQNCEYSGDIEIVAHLRQVYGEKVRFKDDYGFTDPGTEPASVESEISVSAQCLPRNLQKSDEYAELLFELVDKLFWGLNLYHSDSWKQSWRKIVEKDCKESN